MVDTQMISDNSYKKSNDNISQSENFKLQKWPNNYKIETWTLKNDISYHRIL